MMTTTLRNEIEKRGNLTIMEDTSKSLLLKIRCKQCQGFNLMWVKIDSIRAWLINGDLIQNVWPQLTADEREIMISGMCDVCFNSIFSKELR